MINYHEFFLSRAGDDDLRLQNNKTNKQFIDSVIEISEKILTEFKEEQEGDHLENIFKKRDYERVFILPNFCKYLYDEMIINDKTQSIIFYSWLLYTIEDKNIDEKYSNKQKADFERILNISRRHLIINNFKPKNNYKRSLEKIKDHSSSMSSYTRFLQDLYKEYGNAVSVEIENIKDEHRVELSKFLTDILVIQKLMDDLADWEEDYRNGFDTNITHVLESVDGRSKTQNSKRSIRKEHKYIYLEKIIPEYLDQCLHLYRTSISSGVDQKLKGYLEREIGTTKKLKKLHELKMASTII